MSLTLAALNPEQLILFTCVLVAVSIGALPGGARGPRVVLALALVSAGAWFFASQHHAPTTKSPDGVRVRDGGRPAPQSPAPPPPAPGARTPEPPDLPAPPAAVERADRSWVWTETAPPGFGFTLPHLPPVEQAWLTRGPRSVRLDGKKLIVVGRGAIEVDPECDAPATNQDTDAVDIELEGLVRENVVENLSTYFEELVSDTQPKAGSLNALRVALQGLSEGGRRRLAEEATRLRKLKIQRETVSRGPGSEHLEHLGTVELQLLPDRLAELARQRESVDRGPGILLSLAVPVAAALVLKSATRRHLARRT